MAARFHAMRASTKQPTTIRRRIITNANQRAKPAHFVQLVRPSQFRAREEGTVRRFQRVRLTIASLALPGIIQMSPKPLQNVTNVRSDGTKSKRRKRSVCVSIFFCLLLRTNVVSYKLISLLFFLCSFLSLYAGFLQRPDKADLLQELCLRKIHSVACSVFLFDMQGRKIPKRRRNSLLSPMCARRVQRPTSCNGV